MHQIVQSLDQNVKYEVKNQTATTKRLHKKLTVAKCCEKWCCVRPPWRWRCCCWLAGCENERYGKLRSGTGGAIKKRGRAAMGARFHVPILVVTWNWQNLPLFFLLAAFHFWCEISPKCETKSKYSVFLHIIAKFPQHNFFFATFGVWF